MRGTSAEENFQANESYECLAASHGNRVCAYRVDSRRFTETLFKETVQAYLQKISYCGVVSHHQNETVENSIKEFTLGIRTLLLHYTRLWTDALSTIMLPFSFKAAW